MSENKEDLQQRDFNKIIKDFIKDILNTFPELEENLNEHLKNIINDPNSESESLNIVKDFCIKVFPEKFFDILYQNDDIFSDDNPLFFLPGIDFNELWKENVSDKTRETIWKYLQLILFTVVSDISDTSSFGNTAKLFEAINEDELKTKLEKTISSLQECFDVSGETDFNNSGINLEDIPDAEKLHQHVNSMLDGKLGNLAKEIAEETAEELDIDMENGSSVNDIFKTLFKNPNKLMGLVQKVGGKLDEKIKSGDLKESELLAEAGEMVKRMKDMPGMENLQSMLGKMGKGGGKVDMNAMQAHLDRNMRLAKQKERMKNKATTKNNEQETFIDPKAVEDANKMAMELLQQEGLLGKNNVENLVFSTGEKYNQSARQQQATGQSGKKKRGKKKRKGGVK
tara:strand:- start:2529 stop:3722 length:1194 start_codon:yes stop_codon:yes gene_type:complete